jgi:hypothetical protein
MMKKMLSILVAGVALAIPAAASAEYGQQPGFTVANSNTICAGHGAFGAFGTNGDVTHDFGVNNLGSNDAPGADGTQTGINNSTLCGN